MPAAPRFPIKVREQSVVVKIYRQVAPTNKDGYAYVVTWVGSDGRQKRTYADLAVAQQEAALKAGQLARGLADAAHNFNRADILELTEAQLKSPFRCPAPSRCGTWRPR